MTVICFLGFHRGPRVLCQQCEPSVRAIIAVWVRSRLLRFWTEWPTKRRLPFKLTHYRTERHRLTLQSFRISFPVTLNQYEVLYGSPRPFVCLFIAMDVCRA